MKKQNPRNCVSYQLNATGETILRAVEWVHKVREISIKRFEDPADPKFFISIVWTSGEQQIEYNGIPDRLTVRRALTGIGIIEKFFMGDCWSGVNYLDGSPMQLLSHLNYQEMVDLWEK